MVEIINNVTNLKLDEIEQVRFFFLLQIFRFLIIFWIN
jgi:hypothetical protein